MNGWNLEVYTHACNYIYFPNVYRYEEHSIVLPYRTSRSSSTMIWTCCGAAGGERPKTYFFLSICITIIIVSHEMHGWSEWLLYMGFFFGITPTNLLTTCEQAKYVSCGSVPYQIGRLSIPPPQSFLSHLCLYTGIGTEISCRYTYYMYLLYLPPEVSSLKGPRCTYPNL